MVGRGAIWRTVAMPGTQLSSVSGNNLERFLCSKVSHLRNTAIGGSMRNIDLCKRALARLHMNYGFQP
jgi:hypothetical protein